MMEKESSPEPVVNSLGIPVAEFLEDVDSFMQRPENSTATNVIGKLDELYMKYKFMEQNLAMKKMKCSEQLPEYEKNLEILKTLKAKHAKKEEMDVNYQLDHHLYTRAAIPPTDKICLWLGANVMLEFPIEEAEQFLKKSLARSEKTLEQIELDMDFLKDQITTTEVNMARVFNWDVKRRQQENMNNAAAKPATIAEAETEELQS